MPTSNEDLQKKAEEVQDLRQQVAEAESERRTREAELANDITMAQLEAEEAALKARLATMKQAAAEKKDDAPVAAPLAAARQQMEQAVAQQKAAEGDHEGEGE